MGVGGGADSAEFTRIKRGLHNEILEGLDFEQVSNTPREELAQRLRDTLAVEIEARSLPLNRQERERLVEEILDEILGLGPLEPLLKDNSISDILINGPKNIWIERRGLLGGKRHGARERGWHRPASRAPTPPSAVRRGHRRVLAGIRRGPRG